MPRSLELDEIVEIFSDPDALAKTRKVWGELEPSGMKEAFDRIPSLPLVNFRKI